MRCANCDKTLSGDFFKTAYGDLLCEDCWDEYICSDAGKLEYLIGICHGDLPVEEFDAEFLGEATKSFLENKNLLDLTSMELTEIALKAHELGLL
jgi:recombinational DNA repair protein (RecF pathway)